MTTTTESPHAQKGKRKAGDAEPTDVSPVHVAGQAMEQADYDRREAAELMEKWVQGDRRLWDAIARQFLSQAVWYFLRQWDSGLRRRMASLGKSQDGDNTSGVSAVSERNWYEYPLPGGKRLGDATVADLAEAVNFYEESARSYQREAERLRQVWALMPATSQKAVRYKLSHAKLDQAMRSVEE